jgi:DNA-binding Lrp family transcriptional regulator
MQQIKIDLKDRKILSLLDWDARMPNSEIAKKVNLSKKGVEYRIKRLEQLKVISYYYPCIDFMKFGVKSIRATIRFFSLTDEVKSEIEDYLRNDPEINEAWWASGEWDIFMSTRVKEIENFKPIFNRFFARFGKYIKEKDFSITTHFEELPSNFILESKPDISKINKHTSNIIKISSIEERILSELVKNPKQNSSEIGRKLNLGYKTISSKIKDLMDKGILLNTRAYVDPNKLDKGYYKVFIEFMPIDNMEENIENVKQYLREQKEVIWIIDFIGRGDLDVEMIADSNSSLIEFMRKLSTRFKNSVGNYKYLLFTKNIKLKYLPSSI